jgi:DNA polymerase-4
LRKIIHVDMDAFYASVEQRDFPEAYAGKPIAVGGAPPHGVVMTASYEARAAGGVHSAMASVEAERRCPGLIFVKPRMKVYRDVSRRVRRIFERYTNLVEPVSSDEAYLDVTDPKGGRPASGTLLARQIKDDIWKAERLTASAGVGRSKFVAKVASGFDKPAGLTVVPPGEETSFIAALPIGDFRGVGPVTEAKMRRLRITDGAELRGKSKPYLTAHFGKRGRFFYRLAHGEDERRVVPDRESKSVGAERTYAEGLRGEEEILPRLREVTARVAERLAAKKKGGRTVTLKLKEAKTHQVRTRQERFPRALSREADLQAAGAHLLREYLTHYAADTEQWPSEEAFRLVGLSVSSLARKEARKEAGRQLDFAFGKNASE